MKQIVQTGYVPVSSLGTVFINYLKYFKVYFCFGVIPTIICCTSMFFVLKDKALAFSQQIMSVQPVLLTNNKELIVPALKGLFSTFLSIVLSPSFLCVALINIVITVIAFSCLIVGIKHTFYKKMDLGIILKEGLDNTFRFMWTMLTYFVVYVGLMVIAALLNGFISSFMQGYNPTVTRIITLSISLGLSATIMFYPCIHLFAANNPFSAMYFSFTTFCKSFLSWLIVVIISIIILIILGLFFAFAVISFTAIAVRMGNINNYTPIIILGVITIAVLPYLTNMNQIMLAIMTFIAYPELLDNYPSISMGSSSGNGQTINLNENNSSVYTPSFPQGNQGSVNSFNAGDGLSIPNTHKSDRPFLNQRPDQESFDNLNSK